MGMGMGIVEMSFILCTARGGDANSFLFSEDYSNSIEDAATRRTATSRQLLPILRVYRVSRIFHRGR